MKKDIPLEVERARIVMGRMASRAEDGWNGVFRIKKPKGNWFILIISDGLAWEHVSVEIAHYNRCPTWEEMCWVKDLVWEPEEAVIQIHPKKSEYVTLHPYVLHLWRPLEQELPLPPQILV